MSDLFHLTCKHSAKQIGRYGLVVPVRHHVLGIALSWFTDDRTLPAEALGLTSHTIHCDRMECVYRVLEAWLCLPFLVWAKSTGNPWVGRLINDTKRPEHWFVSVHAVRVRRVLTQGVALAGDGDRTI